MEWITALSVWAKATLQQAGTSPTALPFAFLLGLASSLAAACCTLPIFGAIVGYAGTREAPDKRANLLGAVFFMLGSILALVILGAVAGLVGQVAQSVMGRYWKIFAGFVAIIVGLAALNLLPFKIFGHTGEAHTSPKRGLLGAMLVGLLMGGAVSVCSLGCNPGIFIILGVAVLQGYTVWMFGVLIAYAIGFSLPLTVLMLGVSLGKFAIKMKSAEKVIRIVAGVIMIAVGFYFFKTY